MRVVVYTPESGLRNPAIFFRELISEWRNSFGLGWRLFLRDLKGEYRQSIFGITWTIIPPIVTAASWIFLNKLQIIHIGSAGIPYPAFVLTSTLLWSTFAQSFVSPIQSMHKGKSMIVKLNFPKESLLLSGIFQIVFDLLIRIILIVIILAYFHMPICFTMLLAPIGIAALILTGFTLGILLLPMGMLFSDISRLMHTFIPIWMLLTPVIYPAPIKGIGILINQINPVSPVLSTTRNWIFNQQTPLLKEFIVIAIIMLTLFVVAISFFKMALPFIIERSGS